MNNITYFLILLFFMNAQTSLYWDLGISISPYANHTKMTQALELSTYHRIEGLKKYYVDDLNGALVHFEILDAINQKVVFYEYVHSYYLLGEYNKALSILESLSNSELSDNILYLKSQIFMMLGDYENSHFTLEYLKNNFPVSDYLEIIKFDLEKINLLK